MYLAIPRIYTCNCATAAQGQEPEIYAHYTGMLILSPTPPPPKIKSINNNNMRNPF